MSYKPVVLCLTISDETLDIHWQQKVNYCLVRLTLKYYTHTLACWEAPMKFCLWSFTINMHPTRSHIYIYISAYNKH